MSNPDLRLQPFEYGAYLRPFSIEESLVRIGKVVAAYPHERKCAFDSLDSAGAIAADSIKRCGDSHNMMLQDFHTFQVIGPGSLVKRDIEFRKTFAPPFTPPAAPSMTLSAVSCSGPMKRAKSGRSLSS